MKSTNLTIEEPHPIIDSALQALVFMVNNHNYEINITLNVNGVIISGKLCSGKEYFNEIGEAFKQNAKIEKPEKMKEILDISKQIGNMLYTENNIDQPPPYIHLKDAIFFGKKNTSQHFLWRGKLSDVNGFHLGYN